MLLASFKWCKIPSMAFEHIDFRKNGSIAERVRIPLLISSSAEDGGRLIAEYYTQQVTGAIRRAREVGNVTGIDPENCFKPLKYVGSDGSMGIWVRSSQDATVAYSTEQLPHEQLGLAIRFPDHANEKVHRILIGRDNPIFAIRGIGVTPTEEERAMGIRRVALVAGVIAYREEPKEMELMFVGGPSSRSLDN